MDNEFNDYANARMKELDEASEGKHKHELMYCSNRHHARFGVSIYKQYLPGHAWHEITSGWGSTIDEAIIALRDSLQNYVTKKEKK